jgi:glycine cleavage system protein P-like pyridoxal-binding family
MEELNDQRKRKWEKIVGSTNFIRSSRKAWILLRKLGTDLNTGASSPTHLITVNYIASRLQGVSKVPMDQSHVRSTKRVLRQKRRELTVDPDLSANFSTEELNTAVLAVKS